MDVSRTGSGSQFGHACLKNVKASLIGQMREACGETPWYCEVSLLMTSPLDFNVGILPLELSGNG